MSLDRCYFVYPGSPADLAEGLSLQEAYNRLINLHNERISRMGMDKRKWLSLGTSLLPIILGAVGVPPIVIPLVVHGMQTAEQIEGATGAEKKAHVLDLVKTGITAMNEGAGRVIADPNRVTSVVSQGIDVGVQTVNLVNGHATEPNQLNLSEAVQRLTPSDVESGTGQEGSDPSAGSAPSKKPSKK